MGAVLFWESHKKILVLDYSFALIKAIDQSELSKVPGERISCSYPCRISDI